MEGTDGLGRGGAEAGGTEGGEVRRVRLWGKFDGVVGGGEREGGGECDVQGKF